MKVRVSRLREIPRAIWALGFVSLLMDASSEIIHALLPIYLVTVLGASMFTVGLIEGIAEATASITKVFSGALSDWWGKRKVLALIGYGLAAFACGSSPLTTCRFKQPCSAAIPAAETVPIKTSRFRRAPFLAFAAAHFS